MDCTRYAMNADGKAVNTSRPASLCSSLSIRGFDNLHTTGWPWNICNMLWERSYPINYYYGDPGDKNVLFNTKIDTTYSIACNDEHFPRIQSIYFSLKCSSLCPTAVKMFSTVHGVAVTRRGFNGALQNHHVPNI